MLKQLKLITCATVLGLSTYAVAQAASNTGNALLDHPGWVHVPGELVNPACVHQVPKGAVIEVNQNGQMTGEVTVNGSRYAQYAPCPDAPVVMRPQGQTPNVTPPIGTTDGWVETAYRYVSLASTDNIDYLGSNWTVPTAPADGGALIYLFNAIEPSNEEWILQPVLQYGYNDYFGGDYWEFAAWAVGPHYVFYSDPIEVYVGDVLYGVTQQIGFNTYNDTVYYEVQAQDTSSSRSTWLSGSSKGLHWVYGFDGTLEAYYVTSCSQYPGGSSGSTVFSSTAFDHNYSLLTPINPQSWTADVYPNSGPSCGFSVTPNATGSTLDY
jgi:hypothetical protein